MDERTYMLTTLFHHLPVCLCGGIKIKTRYRISTFEIDSLIGNITVLSLYLV